MNVYLSQKLTYKVDEIFESLPDEIFLPVVNAGSVVLKPNWVSQSHGSRPGEWESLITHPAVITAVLKKVIMSGRNLKRIIITDGPQTDSSFSRIMELNPVSEWREMASAKNIELQIIDLRDDEWITSKGVVTERRKLPGDPAGKSVFNLTGPDSEFYGHSKSPRGYYGADYNISEVNTAHNGNQNLYSVSRSVMEADLFINLPKLKTHKKAGITACLKNLVGINTYKNFLPHHSEGDPSVGGDQFPDRNLNAMVEGPLLAGMKQTLLRNPFMAKLFAPMKKTGERLFGKTSNTIRSGNWYGNDTLWRTILDLNKILLYGNPDGTMRRPVPGNRKPYIAVVDAIIAGQGNGPLEPEPVQYGRIITGSDPVAVDAVCASLMSFDPMKIPSISHAFTAKGFPLTDCSPETIRIVNKQGTCQPKELPVEFVTPFTPHFGWIGHIEKTAG